MPEKENAKWYVVHTYSGYENKVKANLEKIVENRNLQHLIHQIIVPTEKVVEIKDGKKKTVERKIFPGYVLVKMVMTDD
ncbi:MAG TPA: transcription termination/antitermination protein NusG, partial [Thermoanaerobacter sp.]|nr:transcription termination/antitermination protein NusG [Thermoanaerobacter sp.]